MKYKDQKENEARLKADAISKELPSFVRQFFMQEENHLSGMTLYSYASQLRTFFQYLRESSPYFAKKEVIQITTDDMDALTDADIAEFLHDSHAEEEEQQRRGVCMLRDYHHALYGLS